MFISIVYILILYKSIKYFKFIYITGHDWFKMTSISVFLLKIHVRMYVIYTYIYYIPFQFEVILLKNKKCYGLYSYIKRHSIWIGWTRKCITYIHTYMMYIRGYTYTESTSKLSPRFRENGFNWHIPLYLYNNRA